jgi:hypothetical protein
MSAPDKNCIPSTTPVSHYPCKEYHSDRATLGGTADAAASLRAADEEDPGCEKFMALAQAIRDQFHLDDEQYQRLAPFSDAVGIENLQTAFDHRQPGDTFGHIVERAWQEKRGHPADLEDEL